MNQIPEDFTWDCQIFALKCEIIYLIKALMPLSLTDIEKLTNQSQILPTVLAENISYIKRFELEKKLEHLPIKILWSPHSQLSLYHYQYAQSKLNLEKPFLNIPSIPAQKKEKFLKELNQYESLYTISDFTIDYKEESNILGLRQTLEDQKIFNQKELEIAIDKTLASIKNSLSNIIKLDAQMLVYQVKFIPIQKPIEIHNEEHINLTSKDVISNDFSILLPDLLVRALYLKIIHPNNNKSIDIFNQNKYQENIFEMQNYIYMVFNQWLAIKNSENFFRINFSDKIQKARTANSYYIQNQASGTAFQIYFKLDISGLVRHHFSVILSTELIEILIKAS